MFYAGIKTGNLYKINNFTMNNKDFIFLKKFEDNFYTATRSNFSRNISRTNLEKFSEIIEKETGKIQNINFNCSICALNLIKKMAELQYKEKNKKEEKDKEVE